MRRRVRLSAEGWYFLLIVLFVIGGAVLRDVGLLVCLAGMMIAPLLLQWRHVSSALSGLEIERDAPDLVSAGTEFALFVRVKLIGARRSLSSLELVETVAPAAVDGDRLKRGPTIARSQALAPTVSPAAVTTVRFACRLPARGWHVLGPLRLATRAPFGLLEGSIDTGLTSRCLAAPALGVLRRPWREWVDGDDDGSVQAKRRRGLVEGEFFGMRDWRPGDSPRWVHWRTSARLGRLAVRQTETLREVELAITLDLWAPDGDAGRMAACERALGFAATVVHASRRSSPAIVFTALGKRVESWIVRPGAASLREAMERLALMETGAAETWRESATFLRDRLGPSARVAVVSSRSLAEATRSWEAAGAADAWRSLATRGLWIDASRDELDEYFEWHPPTGVDALGVDALGVDTVAPAEDNSFQSTPAPAPKAPSNSRPRERADR